MREKSVGPLVEIGLRMIGMWPNSYVIAGRMFWITTMTTAQVLQYWYLFTHFDLNDMTALIQTLSTVAGYSELYVKLVIFWINRRAFYDILGSMSKDLSANSDPYLKKTACFSSRISNVIISTNSISVVCFALGVLMNNGKKLEDDEPRELLLEMTFPFEYSVSPVYELVIITQFIHQFMSAAMLGVTSAFLVTATLYAGGQIDLMCQRLENISSKDRKVSCTVINTLLCEHQEIIVFCTNIENLFTYLALIQFFLSTVICCSLGLLIVVTIGTSDSLTVLLKCVMYYVAVTTEGFVYCCAGEYLSSKSKMIGDAAYESSWYDLTPKETRLLLLLMLRSQKQLTITIGKFMDLSLERFAGIIKATGSYISVLYAMY